MYGERLIAAASSKRWIGLSTLGSTLISIEGSAGTRERSQTVRALVDSGAEGKFISARVAQDLELEIGPPTHQYQTLNGHEVYVSSCAKVPILLTNN